jgi:hypothetical protein
MEWGVVMRALWPDGGVATAHFRTGSHVAVDACTVRVDMIIADEFQRHHSHFERPLIFSLNFIPRYVISDEFIPIVREYKQENVIFIDFPLEIFQQNLLRFLRYETHSRIYSEYDPIMTLSII